MVMDHSHTIEKKRARWSASPALVALLAPARAATFAMAALSVILGGCEAAISRDVTALALGAVTAVLGLVAMVGLLPYGWRTEFEITCTRRGAK
jgi:hypothetical protein